LNHEEHKGHVYKIEPWRTQGTWRRGIKAVI